MAVDKTKPISYEETVVRTTYARLAFAVQVEEIYKMLNEANANGTAIDRSEFRKRLKDSGLQFELSNFRVGDLPEISQTKYSELVTKPDGGDALDVVPGTWRYTSDEPKETFAAIATVRWHEQQKVTENWDQAFGTVYPQTEVAGQHSRFATFQVRATFQGRSLNYRAMFLFGKEKTDQETVLPIDTITNLSGSSLNVFLKVPAYPGTLIEGGLGKDPVIYEWLAENQTSDSSAKRHEANCDLATLKCGIHSEDLKLLPRPSTRKRKPTLFEKPRLIEAGFQVPLYGFRALLQAASGGCTQFNNTTAPSDLAQANNLNHITGNHVFTSTKSTSCTYSNGSNSNGLCNTSCSAPIIAIWDESGVVSSACHQNGIQQQQGSANATGAGANCTGGAGGGVKACLFCQCNVNVSLSISGATVTVTSDGFFTVQDQINNSCAAQVQPTPTPTPTPTPNPSPPSPPPDPCLNSASVPVSSGPVGDAYSPDCSPIIIDYSGRGFLLTDASDGVKFDITGTGHPVQMGWTARGADNGFLALPDKNGAVNNGKELFGNFTPQPSSAHPNGYAALALYDLPENGGNGDGIIDARDAIFGSLRLWVDKNHDGIAQPDELFTLSALGIFSISLDYRLSHRQDEFGNIFRYRAKVNAQSTGDTSEAGPWSYDVFFASH
jgi:hypothetical protein